ncbi:YbaB/EbfC family nucleoid-associated protein [Lactimicrobium massiliense]|uniref:YbaB/EbfC family nucleoid-associated protein n=1 Tax=Lactimicrobium massiliense TaxID=2161814 RepID=UPI000D55D283|nr:YbaB/EbfC family nucleoid-associated protein [Lactimicrobium massiliense]
MDFNSILQQAQMMKDNLGKLSEELDERTYTGNNGGKDGATIVINGRYEVQSVTIGEDLCDKDNREMLQDMILLAFNQASDKAREDREKSLDEATGGLNIPGM